MKLIISLLVLLPVLVYGQERQIKTLTPAKRHKVGTVMLNNGSYYNAVEHMKELVKEHPDDKKYQMALADAYFSSRDYKNAELWYKKISDAEGDKVSAALFRYAECLKYNGKYKEAKQQFEKFAQSRYPDKRGESFKTISKNEIESCAWAIENSDKQIPFEIKHLGDHINSKYSEFGPCLLNDSLLIFSSLQSDSVLTISPDEAHPHTVKLYKSSLSDTEWGPHERLGTVNSNFENNANGAFNSDRSKFYFTRCIRDDNDQVICEIYVSSVVNGKFEKPRKLPAKINRKGYTSTQPNIGKAQVGTREMEVLYFSSNRPGGRGGLDLWYSIIDDKGNYRIPGNLGKEINTIRDEISPYYDTTSGNLYFSSNFHYGFGGFDVFSSAGSLNRWETPSNLGKPVNTRVDDTYFTKNGTKNEGFLVSNRPEGYHLTSETCCDDIYSYSLSKNLILTKISAFNNKTERHELGNVRIRLFERNQHDWTQLVNQQYAGYTISADSSGKVAISSDSSAKANKQQMMAYLRKGEKPKPAEANTLISAGSHESFPDASNSYMVYPGKEYLAAAITDKDTTYFLYSIGKEQILQSTFSADTALTEATAALLPEYKLVKVNLFFNKLFDSSAFVKAEEQQTGQGFVENEKSNTVSRAMRELEAENTKDLKIILNYDFDDTKFIEKHSGSLDSLVILLNKYPKLKIFIAAHTDSKGSDEYNFNLSKRRAKSIMDYLAKHDISKKRMSSKGYGETLPLVPNENPDGSDNPENRWLNRRAEITLLDE